MRTSVASWLVITSLLIAGCDAGKPVFHDDNPQQLSAWHLADSDGNQLRLNTEAHVYFLNSSLFTDYAHKLRTLSVPEGQQASVASDGGLQFPVGTIISKTFYYPRDGNNLVRAADNGQWPDANGALDLDRVRLIETRLLVHRDSGWVALPYVWNEAQTEAYLSVTGDIKTLTLHHGAATTDVTYLVPDQNQCAGCHGTHTASGKINPIGPRLANLNAGATDIRPGQLKQFVKQGWLAADSLPDTLPRLANWHDQTAPLEARARAYLDINCGHCHSNVGPADTSGLFLDAATHHPTRLGICKLPIAAGQGTGGHRYSIVPGQPQDSIMIYRMASLAPGAMMPELGRGLVHEEGVALISDWITAMPGTCD